MEAKSSHTWIVAGIAVLGVAILGTIGFREITKIPPPPVTSQENTVASTTDQIPENGIVAYDQDGNKVIITPVTDDEAVAIPAPSLTRTYTPPKGYPADAQKRLSEEVATLVKTLREKPTYEGWAQLAIYRNGTEDYEGVRQIWEYLALMYPEEATVFGNLGTLYHLHLKQYAKAEINFKKAIALRPNEVVWYRGLFDLYRYSYKQTTTAAEDILKSGLVKNPKNIELLILLAGYYKEKGRVAEAKTTYERAIAEADQLKDTKLVQMLTAELQALLK